MSSHEEMLEQVAAYALGTLPAAEAATVAEHTRACPECAAEYRDLRAAVSAVAYSAEADAASPLLKRRIMAKVRGRERPGAGVWAASALAAACIVLAVLAALHHAPSPGPAARQYAFAGGDVSLAGGHAYVEIHQLAPLPKGHVYQVWTLARGARSVRPSITFTATRGARLAIPHAPGALAAIAISVEPTGGSLHPTTKPIAFVRLGG
jgi:anti-sigma factor RsiW